MRRPLFGGGALLLLLGCGAGGQGPVASDDLEALEANQVFTEVTHYVTTAGVRQAVLRADTAYFHEDSSQVEFRRVRLTLFQESGRETADLTAAVGTVDMRTEAMVARGNVVLVTREADRRIETDELHYDPQRNRIWSDKPTTIYEGGSVLRGEGFDADAAGPRNINLRKPRGQVQGGRIDF